MERISAAMRIDEILDMDEGIRRILLKHGLNCVGCPGAVSERLSEAASGHGIRLDQLLQDLNQYMEQREESLSSGTVKE